jgi:hypothetical protein
MNSLYNITNRFIELLSRDDLTTEEVKELGENLALELKNKAENIVKYNFILESDINALNEEIERLNNIKKGIVAKQDKFKEYVKENMEQLDIEKLETTVGKISIKTNPVSVNILNENEIPKEYIKEKITTSIDKTKIKKDIQSGIEINGATLIQNTRLETK